MIFITNSKNNDLLQNKPWGFSVMSKLGAKSHQYRSVTVLALWTISSYNLGITFTDSWTFKCFFCILFLLTSMSEKGWFWPSYVYALFIFSKIFHQQWKLPLNIINWLYPKNTISFYACWGRSWIWCRHAYVNL